MPHVLQPLCPGATLGVAFLAMRQGLAAQDPRGRYLALLALAALGVVFGDLGTSPLYALHDAFAGPHAVPPTSENVLGVLSLFVWSLVLVVCLKYLVVMMRADNRGEGGIF